MILGTVAEIWRYPVKSMVGERLETCSLGELGVPGDRGWAVRDETAEEIRNARKLPALLLCAATYPNEPKDGGVPAVEIRLPDGQRIASDAPDVSERLSDLLGRPVTLWPRRPPEDVAHYRRGRPDQPDFEREIRQIMDRLDDEPLPDFSAYPPDLLRFACPPGTYFDSFPVSVVTTASLRWLQQLQPGADADVRRFRPNFVIDTDAGRVGAIEADWCGRELRIGQARLRIEMPTVRCAIPAREQRNLVADRRVLRTIVNQMDQNLGAYASPTVAGEVAVGDSVELVD